MSDVLDFVADLTPQFKEAPATVPGLVVHVDGDYMAYYASGNDDCTQADARTNVLNIVASAMRASGAESAVMHNTASGANKGERYSIATVKPYQGQRDSERKPKNYRFLREYLLNYNGDAFKTKTWVNREADDGIGVCSHHAITGTPAGYAAIFTRDKDMQMLPGLHVDWLTRDTVKVEPGQFEVVWKPERAKEGTERVYGLKWFWLQMLMGDAADHIPGLESFCTLDAKGKPCIRKMGKVTAMEMLEDCYDNTQAYRIVSDLYVNYYQRDGAPHGTWADRFCEQAALLWMRTDAKASVGDFARHTGHSKISDEFCSQTWEAVQRLETRVRNARQQVNEQPS